MFVCYAAEAGDLPEQIDNPGYPVRPSTEALRLGLTS